MAGRRTAHLIVPILVIVVVTVAKAVAKAVAKVVANVVAKAVATAAIVIAAKRSPPGEIRNAPQGHHVRDLII